jgi:uncharacterized membrane protein YeaQ/YmgE (transglycosylase-associated protein family)
MVGLHAVILLQEKVVVVEWRRGLIGWLIIGLLAGWLAGKLARGRGFGCIGDIVLGLIGSVIGGWIFTQLGIVHSNTFLYSLAAATVGAVILVSIAREERIRRRGKREKSQTHPTNDGAPSDRSEDRADMSQRCWTSTARRTDPATAQV